MSSPATMETAARAGNRREPIDGVKQILITVLATLLVSVILGFVALSIQLSSIQRQMHEDLGRIRNEIRGLRTEMRTEFRGVRDEIRGLRDEMRTEFRGLSDQMTRIETLLQIRYGPLPGS